MLIISKHGCFSIVRRSPNAYFISSQVKKDLEHIRNTIGLVKEISESDDPDAPYQMSIGGEVYRTLMQVFVKSVDYDNFEAALAMMKDKRGKLGTYHRLRQVLGEDMGKTESNMPKQED